MNLVGIALAVAGAAAVLGVLAALVAPRRVRPTVVGIAVALCGAAGAAAGVAMLSGQGVSVVLPGLLPLTGVVFTADVVSGVFVCVVGAVAVAAGIYGIGYAGDGLDGRGVQAMLPLFTMSMVGVPVAGSVGTLLLCWELMAAASLLLVLAEHAQRAQVASAARWYAVMTHLGFVTILIGLLVLAAHAADDDFAALRVAASKLSPGTAGLVFVLTLAGFAGKAGIVPLHAWLPRAHPEAPSHVSALMSAAMVTMGVYGIVRVGFDLLGGGSAWWWLLVMALGIASALYGILQAAIGTDLKRLLGYSTTENMGLVLIGVGAGGLFALAGNHVLAGLALSAALLHVINHAGFKTVLFLAAGSVLHGTGLRDLDLLGGLRARMPATTLAFGLGALAGSALPPGAAFVSEWLLLQALVHGLAVGGLGTAIMMPVAVGAVALSTGLAVATFVKAFGVGFLARPRSRAAEVAVESPPSMLAGMVVAGAGCVALALFPALVLPAVSAVPRLLLGAADPVVAGVLVVRLRGFTGSLSPVLVATAVMLGTVAVGWVARGGAARRHARACVRLWDCGAGPLSARMEYTATSFAEPLQRVFDDVVRPEHDVDVTHHRESRYLAEAVTYRLRVPDRIEHRLYDPVLQVLGQWGRLGPGLATGSVHRYLGYGFYSVCALLGLLVALR
jgi:formate hydrogenlyase subunit 3/multisubunit Na+/H+ antiporter MnhD subunit